VFAEHHAWLDVILESVTFSTYGLQECLSVGHIRLKETDLLEDLIIYGSIILKCVNSTSEYNGRATSKKK
jgi:hypothetical protein